MISFALVLFHVRSPTVLLGELSLACDAFSFLSVEPDVKGRGTMEFIGIGIAFARVPFAELAFTTLEATFAVLEAFVPFAERTAVRGPIVGGLVRGLLTGVVVGFVVIEASTNNRVVTEGIACEADFPCEPFACGFEVGVLLPDAFTASRNLPRVGGFAQQLKRGLNRRVRQP